MRLEVVGYWRWYRGDSRPGEFSPFDYGHTVPKCNCFCWLQTIGFLLFFFNVACVCGMHACMYIRVCFLGVRCACIYYIRVCVNTDCIL